MDLENMGLDCPVFEFDCEMPTYGTDCTTNTFEIGEFYPIGANNGKLTIKQNNEVIGEFYADQSEDTEINIDLSDYVTSQYVDEAISDEATARADADTELSAEFDTKLADKASIAELEEEANLREEEDARLAGEIDQLGTELNAETNARTQADTTLTNAVNAKATISALTTETTNRENADIALQSQIDAITSKSDIVDIVGTKADLDEYDTSDLGNNDIVKVLNDETHDDAPSYYRWSTTTNTWSYVGSEAPAFTKAEAETLFVPKTRTINNKALSANVTLTTSDLTNDSGYVTEADLTDYVKNTDYAGTSTGGVVKTGASYGTQMASSGILTSVTRTYAQYTSGNNAMFIGKATLENVLNERKYLMPEYTLELPATGEANKLYLTPATEQPDVEATASGKTVELTDASEGDLLDWTIKGDTEQNGTPTPTAPVEVKTVTGRNVVSVVGKNLFDGGNYEWSKNYLTATGTWGSNTSMMTDTYIEVLPDTDYIISWSNGTLTDAIGWSGFPMYNQYRADKSVIGRDLGRGDRKANEYISFRTEPDCKYVRFAFYTMSKSGSQVTVDLDNHSYSDYITNIQLEKGSMATSYQPYSGREVELDLGKNILPIIPFSSGSASGLTWTTENDGTIIINGTSTASVHIRKNLKPELAVNQTYTLSGTGLENIRNAGFKTSGEADVVVVRPTETSKTFTATESTISSIAMFDIYIASGSTFSNQRVRLQLERGSVATEYAPFVSVSRNLFNKYDYKFINSYVDTTSGKLTAGGTGIVSVYIPCEPNTTYTVSKQNGTNNRFCVFETAVEPANDVTVLSSVGTREGENNNTSLTITTGSNAQYLGAFIRAGSTTPALDVQLDSVQIEKGSSATSYQPFYNTPELCKLGDYQDRIFKDGNTWKIEKNVAKHIFNGSESGWQINSTYTQEYMLPKSSINMTLAQNSLDVRSNYFAITSTAPCAVGKMRVGGSYFVVNKDNGTSIDSFKTWLNANSPAIYFALNAPVVTEITHQPLIDQLNALETLATVNGYNMVTTDTQSVQPFLEFGYFRPDPTVTKDEWLWVENHYEQLGGERRYTHNLSVNHHTAQGHWDYAFTIVGKEASHYTQLAQVAYYLFREHAGLTIPVSGTYTEGNTVYLLTKITASSLNQVTIEMRKLSDGSVRSISTGAVQVQDTIS